MYKIISMYTPATPYEQEVQELAASCEDFGLTYKLYPIENLKDWVRNTQQKASVLQQALAEFSCDLVWLDADALILQQPALFDTLATLEDFHICIHRAFYHSNQDLKLKYRQLRALLRSKLSQYLKRRRWQHGEIISNSIYLKNCQTTKELVAEWVALNQQQRQWDQRTLQEILDNNHNKYLVRQLPPEYAKIVPKSLELEDLKNGSNYIGQKQASRKYRREIHKY